MAMVIEDGSRVVGANSFVALPLFKSYAEDRGIDLSELTDSEVESKLILATSYMTARYKLSLKGSKVHRDQALPFPRAGLTDEDGYPFLTTEIPAPVLVAQMELAIRGLTASLTMDIQPGQNIKRRRERLEGVFEEEVEYADAQPGTAAAAPQYVEIDNILAPLLADSSDSWGLARG